MRYLDQPIDDHAIKVLIDYADCGYRTEIKGQVVTTVTTTGYRVRGQPTLSDWCKSLTVKDVEVFYPACEWL